MESKIKWIIAISVVVILLGVLVFTFNNSYLRREPIDSESIDICSIHQNCYCLGKVVRGGTKTQPISSCKGVDFCFEDAEEYCWNWGD